jgi:hypothetical protein
MMTKLGRGWRVAGAVLGLAWLASWSCKPHGKPVARVTEEPPALGKVEVKPIPAAEVRGRRVTLDPGQLTEKVTEVLEHAGVLSKAGSGRATMTVVLEALPFTEGSAEAIELGVKLRLRLTVRPEGAAPPRFNDDLAAVGQAPLKDHDGDGAQAAAQRLAERTIEDLLQIYVARQKLWLGDSHAVAAALASSDNDLRVEAVRLVAARQLREQVPRLIQLLDDDEEGVRDAALGALVTLRERSAVKVIAKSRPMRDAREMRKVLDAIATLGGREAQDYLAFVAETHDDEEIRDMAEAALERLTRKPKSNQPTK